MHIQRINGIKNYRIFQDFKVPAADNPWEPVTVVYGPNGSGKSTLAALFAELSSGTATGTGIAAEVFRRQNVVNNVSETDPVWSNVRVFNPAYVHDNLMFESTPGGVGVSAKHLLTLGDDRIKAEKRIDEITALRAGHPGDLAGLTKKLAQRTKKRDNLLTKAAQDISRELGRLDERFNPRSYKAPKVRAELDKGESYIRGRASQDVVRDEEQIASRILPKIEWTVGSSITTSDAMSYINILRATSITSTVIDELSAEPHKAKWVQEGLALHHDSKICSFCEGDISEGRRARLNAHFDDSFKALQRSIQEARIGIDSMRVQAEAVQGELPKRTELYASLHSEFDLVVEELSQNRADFLVALEGLEAGLVEKESAPFAELGAMSAQFSTAFSTLAVDAVIAKSNTLTKQYGEVVRAAASRIEATRVLDCLPDFKQASEDVATTSKAISDLKEKDGELADELAALSSSDLDPLPKAKQLTRDLALLLGRSEITFKPVGDQYEIRRGEQPASHLSEGEKNAISLLYFLCSLEQHENQGKELIVVIDDPVSSFDDNTLYGASAHLWSRLVESSHCHQLIILTHSFNFFRTWSNQLDRRYKADKLKKQHAIKEMKATLQQSVDGTFERRPKFMDWPKDGDLRIRLRSEYHYLFWTLGHALSNAVQGSDPLAESSAAAIMPNVARRLLESFLAFKSPAKMGSFEASVTASMDDVDEAIKIRMVKFLHRFSHNEQGDIDAAIRPEEALPVLASVFSLINSQDREHFESTCISLELDGTFLLALASVGSEAEETSPTDVDQEVAAELSGNDKFRGRDSAEFQDSTCPWQATKCAVP